MHCNDTITCAITPGAGRVLPTTASVFRAVRKDEWDSGCNQRNVGCQRENECGCANTRDNNCGNNCGTAFANGHNTNCECKNNCGCNTPCTRETTCNNDGSCHHHRHGHHNQTPAMVYEQEHDLGQLHQMEEAIRKGTLFPQLYMPMKGECADACGAQLCDGQAEAFAAWELRLYLNTHPCDQQALKLFRQLARKTRQPNYATSFAQDCDEGWRWTDAPWPWEFNGGCE